MKRVGLLTPWLAFACLLAAPLLSYVLGPGVGFRTFLASLVFGLVGVVSGSWLWWHSGRPRAAGRVAIALLPLVLALAAAAKGAGHPMINDVSTDLENPPQLRFAGQDVPFPENSRRELAKNGPKPWLVKASVDMAQRAVLGAIAGRKDWKLEQNEPGRITFVATSGVFRFKDDVVVRLQQAPQGTRVDVRSRSRMGKGDFGANAKRINQLLTAARALLPE